MRTASRVVDIYHIICFFQLLATAIQHEKPELEVRKTDLLRKEEELKIELAKLEDQLLEVSLVKYISNKNLCDLFFNKRI
jgi:hypothetical protein